jgi:ATP-dependent Clp protease ATP-binding subunit ClpA
MLRAAKILALDHVALLAGTSYRGQYEERIRALVAETSADPDAILFIDELHNLIGQGTALGVAMDAANMLKPALVRGDFRVIGATTSEEYERWICNDPALERRFQKLLVRELTAEETMDVLLARQERLERHHHVLITPEALRAAIELTDLHVKDRRRPDRAIDALDEACAHLQATTAYSPEAESIILHMQPRSRRRGRREEPEQQVHEEPTESPNDDESIEQFARNGFAALERFGAELEAMLVGAPQVEQPAPTVTVAEEPAPRHAPPARDWPALRALLQRDAVTVGGVDVARVVALATGQTVRWSE